MISQELKDKAKSIGLGPTAITTADPSSRLAAFEQVLCVCVCVFSSTVCVCMCVCGGGGGGGCGGVCGWGGWVGCGWGGGGGGVRVCLYVCVFQMKRRSDAYACLDLRTPLV